MSETRAESPKKEEVEINSPVSNYLCFKWIFSTIKNKTIIRPLRSSAIFFEKIEIWEKKYYCVCA